MIRLVLIAGSAILAVSAADAQETIQIPYTPADLAVYAIEQVDTRTSTVDDVAPIENSTTHSTLELRGQAGSYSALWTVVRFEGEEDFGYSKLLVDLPLLFTLGASGEPIDLADWPVVRQALLQRAMSGSGDILSPIFYETVTSRNAARMLTSPLLATAPCHNVVAAVGEPERSERTTTPLPETGDVLIFRTTTELRSVDREHGHANVAVTFEQTVREGGEGEDQASQSDTMTLQLECVVDMESGMVSSAQIDLTTTYAGHTDEQRSAITITRQ